MSKDSIEIKGSTLVIDGDEVEFNNTIGEYIEVGKIIVVRLKLTGESYGDITQNVYAIDPNLSIRWQIDECPDLSGGHHDAYSGLFNHDGELWVTNLNGIKYKINKQDGSIEDKVLSR